MEARSNTFESPRWYWIFAVWMGIGLFDATQTVFVMRAEGMHHYWTRLYFTELFSWLPFMVATPFILPLGRKFPLSALESHDELDRTPRCVRHYLLDLFVVDLDVGGMAQPVGVRARAGSF